jgi:histidinol-phosphate aminotransferase
LSDIEAIASSPPAQKNCIIVVDEAYVDFSTAGSAVSLLPHYDNIVVLQTLSKAFGLAAIRCGFCLGAPDVIQLLNNVKAPYNVNELTSRLACTALESESLDQVRTNIAALLAQREFVAAALRELDCVEHVHDSDANFILVRMRGHAHAVYKKMADDGVVTRFRGTEMHCEECIRVTIGTPEENEAFLVALQKTYSEYKDV